MPKVLNVEKAVPAALRDQPEVAAAIATEESIEAVIEPVVEEEMVEESPPLGRRFSRGQTRIIPFEQAIAIIGLFEFGEHGLAESLIVLAIVKQDFRDNDEPSPERHFGEQHTIATVRVPCVRYLCNGRRT